MSRTVAVALVDVFEQLGVKHVLGLIGDFLTRWVMPSGRAR